MFTQMNSIEQILQYVRGVVEISKTKVIKTIYWKIKINNEQKLCIGAYIANATLLVGGTIICSILGLSIDKHAIVNKLNWIVNIWPTIEFIIIDEISMVGCNMIVTIHLKLQKLKPNILPFGGMNIMFMGDFLQFPPINDTPLYLTNIQTNLCIHKTNSKKIISKIYGILYSS